MLLSLAACSGIQATDVTVDGNFLGAVKNLLDELSDANTQFEADRAAFAELKGEVAAISPQLDASEAQRKEVFDCLVSSYNTLKASVDACLANKVSVGAQGELDKRDIANQIAALQGSTTVTIEALRSEIEGLNLQILELSERIKTLGNLSEAAMDQALVDLAAARSVYGTMVLERMQLLSELDGLYTRCNAYNNVADTDIADTNLAICLDGVAAADAD